MPMHWNKRSGQAVVEYLLLLLLALGLVAILSRALGSGVLKMWKSLNGEIAAACPGCPSPAQGN